MSTPTSHRHAAALGEPPRRTRYLSVFLTTALAMCAGCAVTKFRPATAKTNGIRYYNGATYILIKPDYENAKASVTFLTLPDTTQTYAVDSWSWMASNQTQIDFKDGMIAKAATQTNSVRIPRAVVEASAAVGQKLLDVAASKAALASAARAGKVESLAGEEAVFLFYSGVDDNGQPQLVQVYPPR